MREYLTRHKNIRTQIRAVNYHGVQDKGTAAQFLPDSLRDHPDYNLITLTLHSQSILLPIAQIEAYFLHAENHLSKQTTHLPNNTRRPYHRHPHRHNPPAATETPTAPTANGAPTTAHHRTTRKNTFPKCVKKFITVQPNNATTSLAPHKPSPQPHTDPPSASDPAHYSFHFELGHIHPQKLQYMATHNLAHGRPSIVNSTSPRLTCTGCLIGKKYRSPFHSHSRQAPRPANPHRHVRHPHTTLPPQQPLHDNLPRRRQPQLFASFHPTCALAALAIKTLLASVKRLYGHIVRHFTGETPKDYVSHDLRTYYAD